MPKGRGSERRICKICGAEFFVYPSQNNVTCGKKCSRKYAKIRQTGRKYDNATRQKMSTIARERDPEAVRKFGASGTAAAKLSPKAGRFVTNINAKDWMLISPEGQEFRFHSLALWMRENCEKYFDCKPDTREFVNAMSGLRGAKRCVLGGSYKCPTYKGWRVIPTGSDFSEPPAKVPPPKISDTSREGGTPL